MEKQSYMILSESEETTKKNTTEASVPRGEL